MSNIDDQRWLALQTALHQNFLERAFAILRAEAIEPILIKGWAAVRYYPENARRAPGDVDLCVAPERFAEAIKLFAKDENAMPVDIHNGIRHLDTLPFDELFARSQSIKVGETDVRVLAEEDHLRVLSVHWLNDGGAYKEKLKDIHYAVENRAPDFDWNKCLNAVDERHRRWIACTILLAHRYLGTNIAGTPLENEKPLPGWLIKAVEKEWATDVRLRPVYSIFTSPKILWQQFRKRIPPNPVQATVELGGDFDRYPRAMYQAADVFYRLYTTLKRKRIVARARGK
jgi:Uncharacterised nucleotidyltransferase